MVNPQLEAADKLAEVVSLYLEGRADQDELKEAAINYYAVHEKRLFAKDIGEMLLTAKPPLAASGDSVTVNAFTMQGPAAMDPFICNGGTRRCEDCRCGLGYGDRDERGYVKPGSALAQALGIPDEPPAPPQSPPIHDPASGMVWSPIEGVTGFPVAPMPKPLDPFPLPQQYLPEVRDGMSFKAEAPEWTLYGRIRWDSKSGRFFCYPEMQHDKQGRLIGYKANTERLA